MNTKEEWNIKIPGGVFKIVAGSNKEAITLAYTQYIDELRQLFESGAIYSIPEIYKQTRVGRDLESRLT